MKLDLRDITLCAVDCVSPTLALRALDRSQEGCDFHRSILFTDSLVTAGESTDIVRIDKLRSVAEYSSFVLKRLNPYIETDFVLIVQWDGFVIDPAAWDDSFREYDYVGAKWPWFPDAHIVGNGGFSLRSKKLLVATSDPSFIVDHTLPEDVQICRLHRERLESDHSIVFAPEFVADAFAYERSMPDFPTFGFHGLFNMWRHCDDSEIMTLLGSLSSGTRRSREYVELMFVYFQLRKFPVLVKMYSTAMEVQSRDEFRAHVQQLANNDGVASKMVGICEELSLQDPA